MVKLLNELIKEKKVCCVFSDLENTDKFSVGYVLAYDKDFLLMENISPLGKKDGITCRLIEDVHKIEIENQYGNNMEKLFRYYKNERSENIVIESNMLNSIINYSIINNKICSIALCDSNYDDTIGYITKIDDSLVHIRLIDKNGYFDGEASICIDKINYISCDNSEYRIYEILNKLNYQL